MGEAKELLDAPLHRLGRQPPAPPPAASGATPRPRTPAAARRSSARFMGCGRCGGRGPSRCRGSPGCVGLMPVVRLPRTPACTSMSRAVQVPGEEGSNPAGKVLLNRGSRLKKDRGNNPYHYTVLLTDPETPEVTGRLNRPSGSPLDQGSWWRWRRMSTTDDLTATVLDRTQPLEARQAAGTALAEEAGPRQSRGGGWLCDGDAEEFEGSFGAAGVVA
jgi:hypothetical protein